MEWLNDHTAMTNWQFGLYSVFLVVCGYFTGKRERK